MAAWHVYKLGDLDLHNILHSQQAPQECAVSNTSDAESNLGDTLWQIPL
jgi:hypothetical protein